MSFELQGKVDVIFETQQVTDRFKKREFVVATQDGAYTEQIKMQLTQERCDLLDDFNVGDEVKVMFNLKGRAYTKDGKTSYFTNLDAWRISAAGGASNTAGASSEGGDPGPSIDLAPDGGDDDVLPF